MDDRKTLARDVGEGLSSAAKGVMARNPDVEAVCFVVLSRALNDSDQLVGLMVGADGPDDIRPDQYLRMNANLCRVAAELFVPVRRFDAAMMGVLESQARRIHEQSGSPASGPATPAARGVRTTAGSKTVSEDGQD